MSQVAEVRTLQEIDDEAANLRAALEEVEHRLAGSEALNEARTRFAAADSELAEVRKGQRRIEGELEGLTARIAPEEKRLYDGSVRSPKELTNIQHEVDLLKQHRSKLEDELLEVMTRLEAAEAEHRESQKGLTRGEARREAERADLARESTRLAAAIVSADAKRLAQRPKIEARNLAVYEDVRRRRDGVAVARVTGGNCGGCRVGIPEAVRKRAFTADVLAQCPNCERILYVG